MKHVELIGYRCIFLLHAKAKNQTRQKKKEEKEMYKTPLQALNISALILERKNLSASVRDEIICTHILGLG